MRSSEVRFWIMRERIGTNGKEGFNEKEWRSRFDLLK